MKAIPLLIPAIANGDHGINFIMKPPVLQITPVINNNVIALFLFKLNPKNFK